jgi:hypothetical protein
MTLIIDITNGVTTFAIAAEDGISDELFDAGFRTEGCLRKGIPDQDAIDEYLATLREGNEPVAAWKRPMTFSQWLEQQRHDPNRRRS